MTTISVLLGGLGLILVGMWLMTDGLKVAAGEALRDLLHSWTNTRLRGLVTGFSITALVQASGAVTLATIGFANAGLITLEQAIWVIFGSNIGTTMTGWIVSLVGFRLNIEVFALPLIGIGMLLRLTGGTEKRGAVGQAIVGFGLFFLGIDVLKDGFETFGANFQLPYVDDHNIFGLLLYVFIGFLLSSLMQSSSAALVITMSAAQGGLIPLSVAAAAVIGVNLGTTTTSVISVWGATPTAKRVAASHVLFNLLTATIALIIIFPLLHVVNITQDLLDMSKSPAVTLAIFHTLFNILGVILIWPFAKKLVNYLGTRFITKDEIEGKPEFLDNTVLGVPALAANALLSELGRVNIKAVNVAKNVLRIEHVPLEKLRQEHANSIRLVSEIGNFTARLNRGNLVADIADILPKIMESAQKFSTIIGYACDIAMLQHKVVLPDDDHLRSLISQLKFEAAEIINYAGASDHKINIQEMEQKLAILENTYIELKHAVLNAGARGQMSMIAMDAQLQQAFIIRRMAKQIKKAVSNYPEILEITAANNVAAAA
jgi:phosphate:Na+ symporter